MDCADEAWLQLADCSVECWCRIYARRLEATDADEGDNARVTYSLSHGNDKALFHVDERTGAVTTTRRLPPIQTKYRLLMSARDAGSPGQVTLLDVDIVVNDSAAVVSRFTDRRRKNVSDVLYIYFFVFINKIVGQQFQL